MAARIDPVRDDELVITREFDAPVALVFRVWAEREHMVQWLGPHDFECTHLEMDFQPQGEWTACITSEEHGENWMGGRYLEIERDARIVYTFSWLDEHKRPKFETRITVTLVERNGKTVQTFHQAPFESVTSRDSHIGGWSGSFDKEQAYVEHLAHEVRR